jgi:hypothetical protein
VEHAEEVVVVAGENDELMIGKRITSNPDRFSDPDSAP